MVLTELTTDAPSILYITTEFFDVRGSVQLPAGTQRESYSVELAEPLTESHQLYAVLMGRTGRLLTVDTAAVTVTDEPAALTVEDQTTDGESITVASLRTNVDASLFVFDEADQVIGGDGVTFTAGDELESFTVELSEPISTSQEIRVAVYESNGGVIAEESAHVEVTDEPPTDDPATLTVEDQTTDGSSIEIAHLRTTVDASLFVFDADGQEIGGSGVTFNAGDEIESLTVDLYEPLSESQDVRISVYESNGGPIAEETAHVEVTDEPGEDEDDPADLTVEDQTTDGSSIEIAHLRTAIDAALFVFDENGQEIGGSDVHLDPGDEIESFTVDLYEPLSTSQEVRVTVYESNGGPIAEDRAHVEVK